MSKIYSLIKVKLHTNWNEISYKKLSNTKLRKLFNIENIK